MDHKSRPKSQKSMRGHTQEEGDYYIEYQAEKQHKIRVQTPNKNELKMKETPEILALKRGTLIPSYTEISWFLLIMPMADLPTLKKQKFVF